MRGAAAIHRGEAERGRWRRAEGKGRFKDGAAVMVGGGGGQLKVLGCSWLV